VWYNVTYDGHTSHKVWWRHDICYKIIIYVTVTVIQSCDTKKDVENWIDDITATTCQPDGKHMYFRVG